MRGCVFSDRVRQTISIGLRITASTMLGICMVLGDSVDLEAQQKGQWTPGQYGLNAGVIPDPGFTYTNTALRYFADTLTDANGNAISGVTGTDEFWHDENSITFVPKAKFLGGYFAPYVSVSVANGSVVGDIAGLTTTDSGGVGLADTFVAPVYMGWRLERADLSAGYAFTAPTGRFTPGASNNVGSGYWGNNILGGATVYLTESKGTSANLFVDWEAHGKKSGTDITPGQAVTAEWGFGQVLPLDKQKKKLLQVGFVGYGQWQVSDNTGATRLLPHYSVHALGVQTNYVVPAHEVTLFFKYYDEISAKARPRGRTFVFGGSWTRKSPDKSPTP